MLSYWILLAPAHIAQSEGGCARLSPAPLFQGLLCTRRVTRTPAEPPVKSLPACASVVCSVAVSPPFWPSRSERYRMSGTLRRGSMGYGLRVHRKSQKPRPTFVHLCSKVSGRSSSCIQVLQIFTASSAEKSVLAVPPAGIVIAGGSLLSAAAD